METESQKVVDNATDSSVDNTFQNEQGKKVENKIIDYKTYEKLLNRHKKTEEINGQLSKQVQTFQDERKAQEESKLVEQGEYKKLLDLREAEVNEWKQKFSAVDEEKKSVYNTLNDAQKLQAVYDKLPGRLKNQKYMSFIDLESVAFNPETSEIDSQSVDLVVNSFMEEHKDLVDTSHVGRLPGNAPGQTTTPIHKRFADLPLKEMRANMANAVKQKKQELGV